MRSSVRLKKGYPHKILVNWNVSFINSAKRLFDRLYHSFGRSMASFVSVWVVMGAVMKVLVVWQVLVLGSDMSVFFFANQNENQKFNSIKPTRP